MAIIVIRHVGIPHSKSDDLAGNRGSHRPAASPARNVQHQGAFDRTERWDNLTDTSWQYRRSCRRVIERAGYNIDIYVTSKKG